MSVKPSRADVAYRAMRQAIIEQQLTPGTKLPEDEIGVSFAISRTLVRQVLARLKGDGLVDTGGKRTATVARPSLAEARDIFRVRRALEREVIRCIVDAWQPAFGARLEGHVRSEEAASARGEERVSIRLAGEFHILLAELSGNRTLAAYVTQVVVRCSLILALYSRPHSSECAVNEHRDIIAALREADVDTAVQLMDHHVGLVEARALFADTPETPSLGVLLSAYAREIEAGAGDVLSPPRRTARKGRPA